VEIKTVQEERETEELRVLSMVVLHLIGTGCR